MKVLLILNPGSGNGRGRRRWTRWEKGLKRAGALVDTAETGSLEHARQLAREAAGYETVVAVGGDGTINAVLAGIRDAGVEGQRMAVLYTGTSPDFCRFHRIPTDPAGALDLLLSGKTRKVDAASIRFDGPGGRASSWFGCSCSIGLGADVAAAANRFRRRIGDFAGTALAVVRAVALSRPLDLALEIDGAGCDLRRVNHLVILKNPWIASGLRLNVNRRPDDGLLTLMAVTGRKRRGLLGLLPAFYSGSATGAEGVFLRDCSAVRVRSDAPRDVEFDGDPHGRLPADMEIRPRCVELVCGGP